MDKLEHQQSEKVSSTIGYVRGNSTIDTAAAGEGLSSRQDYVTRRWALFKGSDHDAPLHAVDMSAISRLPLPLQVSFRIKMLSIFALQLLVVWAVVGVFRYQPDAKDLADRFFDPPVARVIIAFVVGLALLVALYAARNRFPLNWLLLLLFTAAQSFCFVGLGVVLDTNIGFFNCAFSFTCVVIMIALSGVRRHRKGAANDGGESGGVDEGSLLTSLAAGAIAYVVVALVACALFVAYGTEFVTDVGFGATLGFQLLLILWFAYDASSMYQIMSPDEYMHGVIYFYTDLILLALIVLAAIATVLALVACSAACCDSGGGGCDGAAGCYFCYCDVCYTTSSRRSEDEHRPEQEDMERV